MRIIPNRPRGLMRVVSLVFIGSLGIWITNGLMPSLLTLPDPRPGCDIPLRYRLGTVDPRFPLSERAFRRAVFEAESVWEDALGRDVLVYDMSADFIVTTEFDERQRMTYDSRALEESIVTYEQTAEMLSENYDSQKARYERDTATLEKRIVIFEQDLRDYNRDVSNANKRGSVTEEEFEDLKDAKKKLEDEQSAISNEVKRLNSVIADINALAGQINDETTAVNERVASFQETYGDPQPFIQGLFDPEADSITIYQFERTEDLRLVLAHEFGHALGIDEHVEDDSSALMHAFMDGQDIVHPRLTQGDLEAYASACPERILTTREKLAHYLISTPTSEIQKSDILLLLFGVDIPSA